MIRIVIFSLLLSTLLACLSPPVYGRGLSTTFGEVKLENLKIGEEYSMEEAAEFPLVVLNTSDGIIELKVEVLYPKEGELKEGFEPIPDISWISLEEDYFILNPNEEARTDVVVNIPDDEEYIGRKYQVYLWSHTVGRAVGVGLKSRLLFTVAE